MVEDTPQAKLHKSSKVEFGSCWVMVWVIHFGLGVAIRVVL